MKLNTAFNILLAVICTVSRAHARLPSRLRDPRTVEEKEQQVHRQTMGDYVTSSLLSTKLTDGSSCQDHLEAKEAELKNDADLSPEQAKSLACTAVSNEFEVCQGCQGFSQVDREVHIPGCVGMTSQKCMQLAEDIVNEKADWFIDGAGTTLEPEEYDVGLPSEMAYYKIGLPFSANDGADLGFKIITGVAGDCMVHYPWDWCVDSEGSTVCLKLPPWDCSQGVDGGCLSSSKCCTKIRAEYPGQDINGNELLCYEWVLPVKSSGVSDISGVSGLSDSTSIIGSSISGGVTGNRLVIHLNDGKVAVPAVITDGNYKVDNDEEIIELKEEENCVPHTNKIFPINSRSGPFQDDDDDDGAWTVHETLKDAVKAYDSQGCATNPDCPIGVEYGWPINSWRVEKVTSFRLLFANLYSFNEDVNCWATSQVTSMYATFLNAEAFNQPLDNWDVSQVTEMKSTFNDARAFNQPLDNWDVSKVTIMENMFREASAFNQPLNNWDISSITRMHSMFWGATSFNQNLCQWGEHFNSGASYYIMFYKSGCPEDMVYPTSADGPWCAASCPN